jgi:plasmid stabilization system protein ParE
MKYKVIVQPPARADIEAAYLYLRERAPAAAERWLDGIEKAVLTLEQFPFRCGIAPESREFPEEIRHLLHGRRASVYRILFVIRGAEVRVLHVRHGARNVMSPRHIQT